MNARLRRSIIRAGFGSAVALFCCAGHALGQSISDPIQIGAPTSSGRITVETAIAAALTPGSDTGQQRVVAAWFDKGTGTDEILRVAVTFDGWVTSVTATTFAPALCSGATPARWPDPMVAASPTTGDLWVGSLMQGPGQRGFWAARLPGSATVFETAIRFQCYTPTSEVADKGLLVCGPSHDTGAERLYLGFTLYPTSQSCSGDPYVQHMVGTRSDDTAGQSWTGYGTFDIERPSASLCDDRGEGISPAVIPAGAQSGRLIMSFAPDPDTGATHPASVLYSNDGGANWRGDLNTNDAPILLNQYGTLGQEVAIRLVDESSVPGFFEFRSFPSTAVDRHSPYTTFVVFPGESEDDPGNVDIFVAKGVVDTGTGRLAFPPAQITRITDSMLGDPAGTPQIMPWCVVDGYHGLNILYYAVYPTIDTTLVQARYFRINGSSVGASSELAPRFGIAEGSFIGHYHMITADADCMVYPCYMSRHDGAETRIYTNRINICASDSDSDGLLRTADAIAFGAQYVAQDARADLNRDSSIGPQDVERWLLGMNCDCGTPMP